MITRTTETEVRCDRVGCKTTFILQSITSMTEKHTKFITWQMAVVRARNAGWQVGVNDMDMCPDHHITF